MNKVRKMLIAVLCSVFLVCMGLFAAACNEVNNNDNGNGNSNNNGGNNEDHSDPTTTYYTVTTVCDAEKGEIKLEPAAADGKYEEGTSVTATVTPKEGWLYASASLNNAPVNFVDSKYTFTVESDVTLSVYFKADESDLPLLGVTFDLGYRGTWTTPDGAHTLFVGEQTMSYDGTSPSAAQSGTNTSLQSYQFTVGGVNYLVQYADDYYAPSHLLTLTNLSDSSSVYLAKSFDEKIAANYIGHWYAETSDLEMEISADGIVYGGQEAAFVVDCGYYETSTDGYAAPIEANVYLFLADGTLRTLSWYPDGSQAVVGDYFFSRSKSSFTIPNEDYPGEWSGVTNPDYTLSIQTVDGAVVVKFNGEEVAVNTNAEFKYDGKEYDFTASENILTLHENVYMEDNPDILAGQKAYLFVKKDCPELVIEEADLLGTSWTSAQATMVVGSDGKVTVNGTLGKIVSKLAHDNGVGAYSYTVVAGTKVYDVYHDTAATLYVEDRDGYQYTLGNGQLEGAYVGTWNKSGAGTAGSQLVIGQDGSTFEGKSITLLRSGIVDGYVFTVTDDEGASKTYTVQLLMDFEEYLLSVSYVENNATEIAYYLKDTAIPPVSIDDALVGLWTGGGDPLDIYKTSISYGPYKGTVFANATDTDSNIISYFVYANGDLYLLLYSKTQNQIEFRNYGSSDAGVFYSAKQEHDTSVKLPDKYKGKWSDGNGNEIYVDEEGNLFYNGKQAILEASSNENVYALTVEGAAWTLQYMTNGTLYWHYMDNIQMYFTKLEDVHAQVLQWFNAGTLTETVQNGNTVVVKGLFSGGQKGWNGFVVDVNVNNAWYRLRMDPAAFGLNSSGSGTDTWTQPNDAMYEQLVITGTAWNEQNYLALYQNGGKAWVVVEATLLDNVLTYVIKTYAGTDSKLESVVTTTTFVLTSTSDISSLAINYYFDNDGGTVVLEEAYVEETVRHSVTVECAEGSYALTPEAWNDKYYEEGTEVSLTVTAPQGKVVDSVKVNGSDVSATAGAYKFTVEADTTVVITFKDGDVGGDGVFTVEQQGKYGNGVDSYGTQLATTVVVEADSIYIFNSNMWFEHTFTGDEIVKTAEGEYTLTSADGSFTIKFQDDGSLYIVDEGYLVEGTQTLTKEGAVAGLFTDAQQGKYSDPSGTSPTTLEVTADSVIFNNGNCPLCSNGPYTFTGEELVKVSDNKYTLTASGSTFTIIFNDDGSVTFEDPAWAADGDATLTKGA